MIHTTFLGLLSIQNIIGFLSLIGVVVIGTRYGLFAGAKDSVEILRGLNTDLKEEIKNKQIKHEEELSELKKAHQKEIDALQAQINSLQTQVSSLQQANSVYQDTVTGKETLNKIIELLQPTANLFGENGVLSEFRRNDARMFNEISQVKKMLGDRRARNKINGKA